MTRIEIDREHLMIRASGHAGYAESGNDIVCAAVSTVLQMIERYAMDMVHFREKRDGYLELHMMFELEGAGRLLDSADTILTSISNQYPDHVMVEEVSVWRGCLS